MSSRKKIPEYVKRRIAARQSWKCERCDAMLSEAFQIDHTVPLWNGGADSESNCSTLCANCHAIKTQNEATERAAALERSNAEKAATARQKLLRAEEEKCEQEKLPGGKCMCTVCGATYYAIFPHRCLVALSRAEQKLKGRGLSLAFRKKTSSEIRSRSSVFEEFRFTI